MAFPIWIWVYGSLGLAVPAVVIDRADPVRAVGRSIVLAHRGRIQAENNADRGATFRCFLPLANGHADTAAVRAD